MATPDGMSLTKKLSPEEIAEMSEDCQCSCKELEQLRGNLSLAEEGLANYALDTEHLMLALVQQEGVLNECEALLRQALDEDGVNTDFAQRLYDYWQKSAALADWRTRDMLIADRRSHEPSEQRIGAGIPPDGAPSMPFTGACQHDLLKPNHTLLLDFGGPVQFASCTVCKQRWLGIATAVPSQKSGVIEESGPDDPPTRY